MYIYKDAMASVGSRQRISGSLEWIRQKRKLLFIYIYAKEYEYEWASVCARSQNASA